MVADIVYSINITSYEDVNKVLAYFTENIINIFKQDLIGVYLLGSLTYDDFNYSKSDIDIIIILNNNPTKEILAIKNLHEKIEMNYPIWASRLEYSYVPIDMLANIFPPLSPRIYYNNSNLYAEAHYGNEWLINKYLLSQYGIPLTGPDFKQLIEEIDIEEVQKACVRDLFEEWEPKIVDSKWLSSDYHKSYIILNLCRILYTIMQRPTGSKTIAATWVKSEFNCQWRDLIEAAEQWQKHKRMALTEEVILFIKFVIKQVSKTQLYCQDFKEGSCL